MRTLSAVVTYLFLVGVVAAGETPNLSKIDRKITKEPAYGGKPQYGLLVLGAEAQTRVWMVLDQTNDAKVLYVDLNGNGDLTESQERFATGGISFRLPDFKEPATGVTHTGFSVRLSEAGDKPTVMINLKWRDKLRMGGGYPQDAATGYLRFADTAAQAPVLWANGDGPFRFQRWYSGKLTIGGNDDFKVFIGQQGAGPNSFFAFQEHMLPQGEGVQATLVYTDNQGKEQKLTCKLLDKC